MKRTILIVVYDQINIFSLMSVVEALTSVNFRYADRPGLHYDVRIVSLRGGLIKAWNGYHIDSEPLERIEAGPFDTLIIAGGWGFADAMHDQDLIQWIISATERCRRTCVIGAGLFLAAEAGLLKNRRVAIHPVIHKHFSKRYPSCDADQQAVFTRDGTLWTTAGMSATIDMALAMIEDDLGRPVAIDIARFFAVYVKRRAEERQLSAVLESQCNSDRFEELHAWIRANLSSRLTLGLLASKAGMSVRSFSRIYAATFGQTPMAFVQAARVDAAARALASTTDRVSKISYACGFPSDEQMRRHFVARYGMSPRRYRMLEGEAASRPQAARSSRTRAARKGPPSAALVAGMG